MTSPETTEDGVLTAVVNPEHDRRHQTNDTIRLLGICGSLRAGSYNLRLLLAAQELLPAQAELTILGTLKSVEPFDEDDEDDPPGGAVTLREAITSAAGLLIATPEYNSSLPGQLKNALDWASRPNAMSVLRAKPVAVIGASPSPFGAAWAQAETRKVLAASGAEVIEAQLALGSAFEQFDATGHLKSHPHRRMLRQVLDHLVRTARTEVLPRAG
jgi:chromate reductase, NAD(P)H dehydrogenase (quinone)